MAVFNVVPDKGFSKQTTPRVLITQFGDGYAHRMLEGLNSINTTWSLTFNSRSILDAAEIISFFELAAGVISFQWTPPDETTQYNVVCTEWSQTYDAPIARSITAKFIRVYQ